MSKADFNMKCSVKGRILGWQVIGVDGKVRLSGAPFDNLVVDQGLNTLAASDEGFNYLDFGSHIRFGVGSAEPLPTDTALSSPVGANNTAGSLLTNAYSSDNTHLIHTRRYQTAAGAVVGNLTELGLWVSTVGGMVTHALFRNEAGDPITVTVLAGEQIIVDYELRYYFTQVDKTLTRTLGGVSTAITWRAMTGPSGSIAAFGFVGRYGASRYQYTGGIGNPGDFSSPSGGSQITASTHRFEGSYVQGSFYRKAVIVLPPNVPVIANGIGAVGAPGMAPCGVKIGFVPPLKKTALQTLEITVDWQWSR